MQRNFLEGEFFWKEGEQQMGVKPRVTLFRAMFVEQAGAEARPGTRDAGG